MATISDIAEKAGVSIGTVDRILHKRGRYSEATAEKVMSIVESLNYKPNLMARRLSDSRSCRIAVLLPFPQLNSAYWSLPLSGINRAAKELEPFGVSLEIRHFDHYSKGGNRSFAVTAAEIDERNIDGILMAPILGSPANAFLKNLKKDIPVIFFDTDLPGAKRMAYIGQDSYQSGRLGAQLIHKLIQGKSGRGKFAGMVGPSGIFRKKIRNKILIVTPNLENEHFTNRIRGFMDYSEDDVTILKVSVESDHNIEHFYGQMDNILHTSRHHRTAGIFVTDASVHFTAEYLSSISHFPGGSPVLIGYDLVPKNRQWLEQGKIDFLLTQRPDQQGYNGINRLFRKIYLDEESPEHEYTPIDIVSSENMPFLEQDI